MRRWIFAHLLIILFDAIGKEALLAEVEIEALITFVSHSIYRKYPTAVAFDGLFICLTWLNYYFNAVIFISLVATTLQAFTRPCEVTILAKTKTRALRTNKAGADYWLHITRDTFVISMDSQAVSKKRKLKAFEDMKLTCDQITFFQPDPWVLNLVLIAACSLSIVNFF